MFLATCSSRHVPHNMLPATCSTRHVPRDKFFATCSSRHVPRDMFLATCSSRHVQRLHLDARGYTVQHPAPLNVNHQTHEGTRGFEVMVVDRPRKNNQQSNTDPNSAMQSMQCNLCNAIYEFARCALHSIQCNVCSANHATQILNCNLRITIMPCIHAMQSMQSNL